MTYLVAGALFGLAGSLHCAGMCGPLLLAVSGGAGASRSQVMRRMLLYHASRVFMYVLLGLGAGYAGKALSFGGVGRGIAVAAGALLILAATGLPAGRYVSTVSQAWSAAAVRAGVKATTYTRRHPQSGYVVLGTVNGLVPCGLVYAAVAAAAACGTVAASVGFMTGFGVATVPLLLAITLSAASVPVLLRRRLRLAGPALMAIAGILLIVRAFAPMAPDSRHHHNSGRAIGPSGHQAIFVTDHTMTRSSDRLMSQSPVRPLTRSIMSRG